MAWKSIWLQIAKKPLWGRQSGPTVTMSVCPAASSSMGGVCQVHTSARCVQQQGSTYGNEWVQVGIVAPSLSPFVASNLVPFSLTAPRGSCGDQASAPEKKQNWTLSFASLD